MLSCCTTGQSLLETFVIIVPSSNLVPSTRTSINKDSFQPSPVHLNHCTILSRLRNWESSFPLKPYSEFMQKRSNKHSRMVQQNQRPCLENRITGRYLSSLSESNPPLATASPFVLPSTRLAKRGSNMERSQESPLLPEEGSESPFLERSPLPAKLQEPAKNEAPKAKKRPP
ncbi:hypothetical protein VNO77_03590 [Canavalia gladiata]|uniref:Uncharacterized protein n=1 Tax=Canavalia gladiata TaxID=3824 RepID=A0AAN9R6Z8_CANGL